MTRLAAITGGTGFLGQHITRALAKEGWRLRLLVRRMPPTDLGDRVVELVPGALDDHGALAELVRGADAVVHVAGAIKARNKAEFMAANADGTARISDARNAYARHAPLLMISTMAAREPDISHYAASKAAGEAHVHNAGGVRWILRPPAIYGPGDRATLTVFKAARLPVHPLMNGPEARVCLIHVQDVVSAVLRVLETGGPNGSFELSDARLDGYTWSEIVSAACAAVGSRPRPVPVPKGALRAFGRFGDLAQRAGIATDILTSQKVREILHSDWSSAADARLPCKIWVPKVDLAQGFRETVSWYRANGWLNR